MPPVAYCRSQDDIDDEQLTNEGENEHSYANKLMKDLKVIEPCQTVSRPRKSKESYKDSLFSGNSDVAKSPASAARAN